MTNQNRVSESTAGATTVIVRNDTSNAIGIASFVLGLVSIFFLSFILSPIAIILGIIAIIKKQLAWGIVGLICAMIGVLTSPILLGMLGLTSLVANS